MIYTPFSVLKGNSRSLGKHESLLVSFGYLSSVSTIASNFSRPQLHCKLNPHDFCWRSIQSRWFDFLYDFCYDIWNKLFLPFGVRIIQWFLLALNFKLLTAFWFNLCQIMVIWYETILCSLLVCSAWATQLALQILSFQSSFW